MLPLNTCQNVKKSEEKQERGWVICAASKSARLRGSGFGCWIQDAGFKMQDDNTSLRHAERCFQSAKPPEPPFDSVPPEKRRDCAQGDTTIRGLGFEVGGWRFGVQGSSFEVQGSWFRSDVTAYEPPTRAVTEGREREPAEPRVCSRFEIRGSMPVVLVPGVNVVRVPRFFRMTKRVRDTMALTDKPLEQFDKKPATGARF